MNEIKIHRFESAGMGKAPFRFTGVSENMFSIPGCPEATKPGGSCDYCGASIRWEFHIVSADGLKHKVGCDCIAKVGDKGLKAQIAPAIRAQRQAAAKLKAAAVYVQLKALIERLSPALALEAHPQGFIDYKAQPPRPLTKLDWAQWMFASCGASGRAGVLRQLTKEYPATN